MRDVPRGQIRELLDLTGVKRATFALFLRTGSEVAARREQFRKRFTYALTVTGGPNPADSRFGFRLLTDLVNSDLATEEDIALAESISQTILLELDQSAGGALY